MIKSVSEAFLENLGIAKCLSGKCYVMAPKQIGDGLRSQMNGEVTHVRRLADRMHVSGQIARGWDMG
jgi:hypothetical protein